MAAGDDFETDLRSLATTPEAAAFAEEVIASNALHRQLERIRALESELAAMEFDRDTLRFQFCVAMLEISELKKLVDAKGCL